MFYSTLISFCSTPFVITGEIAPATPEKNYTSAHQIRDLLDKANKAPNDPAAFRSLANGLFQAEGCFSVRFPNLHSMTVSYY